MIRTCCLLLLLVASLSLAQTTQPAQVKLGERISGMYEVSFKPFEGGKVVKDAKDRRPSEILRLHNEARNWMLIFDKAELQQPLPLKDTIDRNGIEIPGYLTAAVNFIKSGDARADVLRTDIFDTGLLRMGVLVAHVRNPDNSFSLLQQVVIEISPRLYYSIILHSPAPEDIKEPTPDMQEAARVFQAIVDSVEPVDLSKVREDQENRLFRTRALFVQWNRKTLLAAIQPEQFLRFRKQTDAGYDEIGYAYVVAQPANAIPRPGEIDPATDPEKAAGLRVGMRLRSITDPVKRVDAAGRQIEDPSKQIDVESWMFVTFDRNHEVWKNTTVMLNPAAKKADEREVWFAEVGASDLVRERVFDKDLQPHDFKELDKDNKLPYRLVDRIKLVIRSESKSHVARPIETQVPPWYLPQAMTTLLPRLVPLNHQTGYLFASYNSESRQVMMRYVDVGAETDAVIDGKKVRAIPVVERLGLEGSPTTHYMSAKGAYLGSINAASKVEILPTDRATLVRLWEGRGLNLNAPEAVTTDAPKPENAPPGALQPGSLQPGPLQPGPLQPGAPRR